MPNSALVPTRAFFRELLERARYSVVLDERFEESRTMDKKNITDRLAFLESTLARNLAWVSAADGKVPSIFALDMAMLGSLCALAPKATEWKVPTAMVFAIAILSLLLSILALAFIAFPRLDGPKESLIYFGGIKHYSKETFLSKMRTGITEEILDDLAHQAYRNAEIAADKFSHARWAMIAMFVGAPFWLASVGLLYAAR